MSDITLTRAQRASLLSLQNTQSLSTRTQRRLTTGLKVSGPSDGPVEFFRAKTLSDRATDYQSYKDNLDQGVSHVQLTLDAITEIDKLLKQIKGILEASRQQNQGQRALATTTINNIGRQIREYVQAPTFNGGNFINNTSSLLEVRFGSRTNAKIEINGYNLANASVTTDNVQYSIFSFNVFSNGIGDGTNTNPALRAFTSDIDPVQLKIDLESDTTTREQRILHETQGILKHALAAATAHYDPQNAGAPAAVAAANNGEITTADFGGVDDEQYYIKLRLARAFIADAQLGEFPDYAFDAVRFDAPLAATARIDANNAGGAEADGFDGIISTEGKVRALKYLDDYMGALSVDKTLMQKTVSEARVRLEGALRDANAAGTDSAAEGADSNLIVALEKITGNSFTGLDAESSIVVAKITSLSATQLQRLIRETVALQGSDVTEDQELIGRLQEYAYAVKGLDAESHYFVATAGVLTAYSLTAIGSDNSNLAVAENAIKRLDFAIDRLRGHAQTFGSHLLTLKSRIDFTTNYINIHTVAAESLTTADLNEEASNLVALQTSQQLGLQSLAIAGQMQRAILALLQSS